MFDNKDNDKIGHALVVPVKYFGDSQEDRDKAIEKALFQFKKLVNKDGLMQDLKDRETFQSSGRKRYLERQNFYYRVAKNNEKQEKYKKKSLYNDKIEAQNELRLLQQKLGRPIPIIPLKKKGEIKTHDGTNRAKQQYNRKPYPYTPVQRKTFTKPM